MGVVMVFRDVTERYKQEQKVRESGRRLKEITANVPGVVYQFNSTSDHVYSSSFISEKAFEIFGLPVNPQIFFEDFIGCLPGDEKDRFLASIREAVDNVAPWHYEGRFIRPDGEYMWFSGNSIPIKSAIQSLFTG